MGKVIALGNEFSNKAMVNELKGVSAQQATYRKFNMECWDKFHEARYNAVATASAALKQFGVDSDEYRSALEEEAHYYVGGKYHQAVKVEVNKFWTELCEQHDQVKLKWGL